MIGQIRVWTDSVYTYAYVVFKDMKFVVSDDAGLDCYEITLENTKKFKVSTISILKYSKEI